MDGHLGRFHIMVIVINAAMNIGVFMFFQMSVWSSFGVSEVGSLDQNTDLFLIFLDISILLSTVAAPICIPMYSVNVGNPPAWFQRL